MGGRLATGIALRPPAVRGQPSPVNVTALASRQACRHIPHSSQRGTGVLDQHSLGRIDMTQRFWVGGLVLLVCAAAACADDKTETKPPAPAPHPGLERLKKLAGTWVA